MPTLPKTEGTTAMNAAISKTAQHEHDLEHAIARYADAGAEAIAGRLQHLAAEWPARRMTRATGCALVVAGCLAKPTSGLRAVLPVVGGLILVHSFFNRHGVLDGLFEQFGFRSGPCIARERSALRALRGDYHGLPTIHDIENRHDIDRLEGEGGLVSDSDETKLNPHEAAHEIVHAM